MKNSLIKTFSVICILVGFVDQVHDNVALIEIETKDTVELIVIDITDIPCEIEEGGNVLIRNKKEIICQK